MKNSSILKLLSVSCLLILLLCVGLRQGAGQVEAPLPQPSTPEKQEAYYSAPVVIDGSVLFHVRGSESYPATRRARDIRDRILTLAKDPNVSTESLRVEQTDLGTDIWWGNRRILTVLEADARDQELLRHEFARGATQRIKEAVEKFRMDRRPEILRRGTLLAGAATVSFLAALFLILWLFGVIHRNVEKHYKTRIQALKVGSFEIVQAERLWRLITGILRVLRLLLLLGLFYVFLQFILSQFPWTRWISERLGELILNPLMAMGRSLIDYLPNLAFLLVLTLVTVYGLKLIRLFFTGLGQGTVTISGFDREWARPTYNLVRILVVAFALVVAYPYIPGSESDAFKGISIFIGVIFSLGSSSAVSNIIAGYTMIYRGAFKVGDRIQIGEFRGDVTAMRLLTTHLRTIKNEIVVVPNSLVWSSNLINYSTLAHHHGLILHTTVGIGYETPWRQVEAMLKLAADQTPGLLKEPPPFVYLTSLDQFSVTYEINVYCHDPHGMTRIYAELHRNILDQFNQHGVQIMTPAYEGDPETQKVVPKDQWYAPPAEAPPSGERGK